MWLLMEFSDLTQLSLTVPASPRPVLQPEWYREMKEVRALYSWSVQMGRGTNRNTVRTLSRMKPGLDQQLPERELPVDKDFVCYIPCAKNSCWHLADTLRICDEKKSIAGGHEGKALPSRQSSFEQLLDGANISIGVGSEEKSWKPIGRTMKTGHSGGSASASPGMEAGSAPRGCPPSASVWVPGQWLTFLLW